MGQLTLQLMICCTQDAAPLDLAPAVPARASGSISREHKRNSTGAFLKGLVASGSTKAVGRRPSSRVDANVSPKGKGRVLDPPPAWSERASSELQREPLVADNSAVSQVGAGSVARHALGGSSATSSHSRSSSNESARSATSAQVSSSATSQPLEWARASVLLSLPKGHSPISFFRICRAPPAIATPVVGDYEDEGHGLKAEGYIYAVMVTVAKLVCVYESAPGEQRRWQLLKELYVSHKIRFEPLKR